MPARQHHCQSAGRAQFREERLETHPALCARQQRGVRVPGRVPRWFCGRGRGGRGAGAAESWSLRGHGRGGSHECGGCWARLAGVLAARVGARRPATSSTRAGGERAGRSLSLSLPPPPGCSCSCSSHACIQPQAPRRHPRPRGASSPPPTSPLLAVPTRSPRHLSQLAGLAPGPFTGRASIPVCLLLGPALTPSLQQSSSPTLAPTSSASTGTATRSTPTL